MKLAEVLHRDVGVIVVGDGAEGFGRGLPDGAEEVTNLLSMKVDDEDEEWNSNKEKKQGLDIETSEGAPESRHAKSNPRRLQERISNKQELKTNY